MHDWRDRVLGWVLWVVGFVVLAGVALLGIHHLDGHVYDDAFIFSRYAGNLVAGKGWTFDPGLSTTNGATSPLWTVVLAIAYFFRRDMESNATLLSAGCLAGAGLLTFATLRRLVSPMAGAAAAILLVTNPLLVESRGMESTLFVLLVAAVLFAACVTDRPVATGVLMGLLVLVRPDGAVLVLGVLGYRWWTTRRPPVSMGVAAALTLVPWLVYSSIALGTPLPGTLAAKMAQGRSAAFGSFGGHFTYIRSALHAFRSQRWLQLLGLGAVVGVVLGWRRPPVRPYLVLLVGFAGVLFGLYGLAIKPPDYLWYYAPQYAVASVLCGVGIAEAITVVMDHLRLALRARRRLVWSATVVVVVATMLVGVGSYARGYPYGGYDALSAWLRSTTPPNTTVAASEIGVVGWRSDRTIVDYLGLLSDQSAREVARGDYRSWIDREKPDLFVAHLSPFVFEATPMASDWFSRAYTPVAEITDVPQPSRVRVYRRRRSREEALASSDGLLVTATVTEHAFNAGVPLSDADMTALDALLAVYIGDAQLQARFEQPDGVDLGGLLHWALTDAPDEIQTELGPQRAVLADLGARITAAGGLVSPLAQRLSP